MLVERRTFSALYLTPQLLSFALSNPNLLPARRLSFVGEVRFNVLLDPCDKAVRTRVESVAEKPRNNAVLDKAIRDFFHLLAKSPPMPAVSF